MPNYITPEVRALIGQESETVEAWDTVDATDLRRMAQAIMDDDPVYWDAEAGKNAGYGGIVAPPLYPLNAVRRRPGTSDPLVSDFAEPDYDGAGQGYAEQLGLPTVPIPLTGLVNGGNEVEVYALAKPGDRIVAKSRYNDIFQKEGRSGSLVFVVTETEYRTEHGVLLLICRQTHIYR